MAEATPSDLEARIQRLEDLEAIRRLKYRYLRALDTKQWDELAETLAEDCSCAYSDGAYSFEGRDAILEFLRSTPLAEGGGLIGVHHGQQPEIDLTGPTTAAGTWTLYNYLVDKSGGTGLRMCALYHDEYVKIDGSWRIAKTGYTRIFEEVWERKDLPSLTLTAG